MPLLLCLRWRWRYSNRKKNLILGKSNPITTTTTTSGSASGKKKRIGRLSQREQRRRRRRFKIRKKWNHSSAHDFSILPLFRAPAVARQPVLQHQNVCPKNWMKMKSIPLRDRWVAAAALKMDLCLSVWVRKAALAYKRRTTSY